MRVLELYVRLANRDERRTEAEIQADVRQLILSAPFELEDDQVALVSLETPVGDRRRIDVEVGSTVIEVKRDLRRKRVRDEAVEQLAGYVQARSDQTGLRYVGVLTDGTEWICYQLVLGTLQEVASVILEPTASGLEQLTFWLEGVLATAQDIAPTPAAISARLGARSSAYALDRATLSSIYETNRNSPTVKMKRELWSRLLTSALGTQFEDTDSLFIEHTLLVNSAEIIAHAVLGLDVSHIQSSSLLSGEKFAESGIYGVVEQDFFDWVVEVDGGDAFVRTLARRLSRFDWSNVSQDILKVLYESIIGADVRKRLGEYYTPDWLAESVVRETIKNPLECRVLDPACGSGTFLFHAIRLYIQEAESAGWELPKILDGVTRHVIGIDLHPVAVTLARVTYLLAIGRARLTSGLRGEIQIPVYLGDSLQWAEQNIDLWSAGDLVIKADDNRELFSSELRFPGDLLNDAAQFDRLVTELAERAASRTGSSGTPSLTAMLTRLAIPRDGWATVEATFKTMCRLHDEGRDHIWGYYVRNLARPMWLANERNRVDVLVGNPPWLAYRNMTADMQVTYRRMSEARGLWAGAKVGVLGRRHVHAVAIQPVGKEADDIEERTFLGEDDNEIVFPMGTNEVGRVLDHVWAQQLALDISDRDLEAEAKISHHTLAKLRSSGGKAKDAGRLLRAVEALRKQGCEVESSIADILRQANDLSARLGGTAALARQLEMTRQYVGRVLKGERPMSDAFARKMRRL